MQEPNIIRRTGYREFSSPTCSAPSFEKYVGGAPYANFQPQCPEPSSIIASNLH